MKTKITLLLVSLTVIALLAAFSWPSIRERMWEARVRPKQEALAQMLGVRIQDYPYPISFPNGYFSTMLKPGMSYSDVHRIVRGYTQVINCFGMEELYEYYGPEEGLAVQVMVVYGKERTFKELRVDTPYDRSLGADASCSYGLLGN